MNWIIEEAKKSNPKEDRVILENPKVVKELDELLLKKYYPFIQRELGKTSYQYSPVEKDIRIESQWIGPEFGRSLLFMLFDDFSYSFFRGTVSCTKSGFFFQKEFFLGLPENTNPSFMFKILSDDNFAGNPPTLEIQKSEIFPEWNTYFYITLKAGTGFEFSGWSLHNAALGNIEAAIHDSILMYEESMIEAFLTMIDVESFLEAAYRCFEAY